MKTPTTDEPRTRTPGGAVVFEINVFSKYRRCNIRQVRRETQQRATLMTHEAQRQKLNIRSSEPTDGGTDDVGWNTQVGTEALEMLRESHCTGTPVTLMWCGVVDRRRQENLRAGTRLK